MHKIRIIIDRAALAYNYKAMQNLAPSAQCGAVVKANAYGLGLDPVCETLWQAGCRTFFIANLSEAPPLRKLLPDAKIYVFEGFNKDELKYYRDYNLHPVINDLDMLDIAAGEKLRAMLHIDTGMSRLGMHLRDIEKVQDKVNALFENDDIHMIMTHLSCADLVAHGMNQAQSDKMNIVKKIFPDIPISMANSSGIIHHNKMHYDLLRAGTALYGGITDPLLKPVVTLEGAILQIRKVYKGEAIGYSATYIAEKDMMIATISGGYADGIPRHLSNTGYSVFYKGYKCPVLGRVSMDSVMIDISHIPEALHQKGEWVEFFGKHILLDAVAELAHTISYGILTGLGSRPQRIYKPYIN